MLVLGATADHTEEDSLSLIYLLGSAGMRCIRTRAACATPPRHEQQHEHAAQGRPRRRREGDADGDP